MAERVVALRVTEDPEAVMGALTSAQGLPFALTSFKDDQRVYVNAATIAFWMPATSRTGDAQFMIAVGTEDDARKAIQRFADGAETYAVGAKTFTETFGIIA